MKYSIMTLTQGMMTLHLATLKEMDRNTIGERWDDAHFAADLPEKWSASRLAFDEEEHPLGFLVASRKEQAFHVHRLVVTAAARGHGIGAVLLRSLAAHARQLSTEKITLKVARENVDAVRFYRGLGFIPTTEGPANLMLMVTVPVLLSHVKPTLDH